MAKLRSMSENQKDGQYAQPTIVARPKASDHNLTDNWISCPCTTE